MDEQVTALHREIDEAVRERVVLLCRWTKTIRHGLGNLLYPGSKLLARVESSAGRDGQRLSSGVRMMTSMLDEQRSALEWVRLPPFAESEEPTTLREMWPLLKPLAKSVLDERVTLQAELPQENEEGFVAPESSLAMVVLTHCIAMMAWLEEHPASLVVREARNVHAGQRLLTLESEGGFIGRPVAPSVLREVVREGGGEVVEDEGSQSAWRVTVAWASGPAESSA
jgi:hypothetical protein